MIYLANPYSHPIQMSAWTGRWYYWSGENSSRRRLRKVKN